jgi:hypothetical protein
MTGFAVGHRESEAIVVNHLLFANDMLIFCGGARRTNSTSKVHLSLL